MQARVRIGSVVARSPKISRLISRARLQERPSARASRIGRLTRQTFDPAYTITVSLSHSFMIVFFAGLSGGQTLAGLFYVLAASPFSPWSQATSFPVERRAEQAESADGIRRC